MSWMRALAIFINCLRGKHQTIGRYCMWCMWEKKPKANGRRL